MIKSKPYKSWSIIILMLLIIGGGIFIWSRYSPSQPIEILLPPPGEFEGKVYLSGAVSNPGIYPIKSSDSLDDVIKRAGGLSQNASLTELQLHIPLTGEENEPQKININLADAWLLEALPGIGEAKAKAIVEYRERNGPFRTISELTKVEGIGDTIYEQIKGLITVTE